jgi:zinc protease
MRATLSKRLTPPSPDQPRDFQFPGFETHTLPNGLKMYLARYDRGPLVQMSMTMTGGAEQDPSGRAGLATFSASLLDEGTSKHSSIQLAERVENLGGYLSTQADWDSMSASVGVLSDNLEEGFGLLAEIITDAIVPAHEVERLRAQRLADIQRRHAQPGVRASETLAKMIYADTPYGMPINGTIDTVPSISRDDLVECLGIHTTPLAASIVATGDLNPEEFVALVHESFGDWKGAAPAELSTLDTPLLEGLRVRVVDRPDSTQTELRMGHVGPSRIDPDYVPLQVMNSLLGGKFTSRINLNLREDLGITYGVSTGFGHRRGQGPFVVSASVDTASTGVAVEEVLREMSRLQEELVGHQELEETKSYLLGVFPYTLQRIEGLASRIAEIAIYDLPSDYYDSSLEQIRNVSMSQVQSLARKHLHPDRIAIVAVGPASDLVPQLEQFGAVEIDPEKSL